MQSDTADNIIWIRYARPSSAPVDSETKTAPSFASTEYPTVEFKTITTPLPLHMAIEQASEEASFLPGTKLVIVVGRSRRLAVENHRVELRDLMLQHGAVGAEVRKTIGDVGTAFVVAGVGSGIVVLQAANAGNQD